jgi:hypothetical protein
MAVNDILIGLYDSRADSEGRGASRKLLEESDEEFDKTMYAPQGILDFMFPHFFQSSPWLRHYLAYRRQRDIELGWITEEELAAQEALHGRSALDDAARGASRALAQAESGDYSGEAGSNVGLMILNY